MRLCLGDGEPGAPKVRAALVGNAMPLLEMPGARAEQVELCALDLGLRRGPGLSTGLPFPHPGLFVSRGRPLTRTSTAV
jgi:hypothetical protein